MKTAIADPEPMPTTASASYVLTKMDRCDVKGCPAQAWILVQFVTGSLYFCSHHFNEHETGLFDTAVDIIDERHRINERSESSA